MRSTYSSRTRAPNLSAWISSRCKRRLRRSGAGNTPSPRSAKPSPSVENAWARLEYPRLPRDVFTKWKLMPIKQFGSFEFNAPRQATRFVEKCHAAVPCSRQRVLVSIVIQKQSRRCDLNGNIERHDASFECASKVPLKQILFHNRVRPNLQNSSERCRQLACGGVLAARSPRSEASGDSPA